MLPFLQIFKCLELMTVSNSITAPFLLVNLLMTFLGIGRESWDLRIGTMEVQLVSSTMSFKNSLWGDESLEIKLYLINKVPK